MGFAKFAKSQSPKIVYLTFAPEKVVVDEFLRAGVGGGNGGPANHLTRVVYAPGARGAFLLSGSSLRPVTEYKVAPFWEVEFVCSPALDGSLLIGLCVTHGRNLR